MRLDGFGRFRKFVETFGFGLQILIFFGGFRTCNTVLRFSEVFGCIRMRPDAFGRFRKSSDFFEDFRIFVRTYIRLSDLADSKEKKSAT